MEQIEAIVAAAPHRIAGVVTLEALKTLEAELTGRRSVLAETRRSLGSLDPEDRPRIGALVQRASAELQDLIDARRATLEREAEDRLLADDRIDMTVEAAEIERGTHHLITQTMDEVADIFASLGYVVAGGPEVELGWYNFDALNTPPAHPARTESDTLYVDWGDPTDEVLLRAHTSPMQIRYMQEHQPPVYVVVPGRVFRADTPDATHSPVFHQIEGLAVDEAITFGDLKGTLAHFAREFFGRERKIRLQPNFFPFTEPSAEMHVSCFACEGTGSRCRVCGGGGWIELMGCGMVDPNVFGYVDYDASRHSGFAFGMGAERLAMVRHGIHHMRHLFENDLRVARQFV